MAILWVEAADEVVQVGAFEGIRLESEVHVSAEVVNPHLFRPGRRAGRPAVEEEDVSLDALGVEDAGWQAQESVNVALLEEATPDRLTAALEEDRAIVDCIRP